MNRTSNFAFTISQDIYDVFCDIDMADNQLHNFEITPGNYNKRLYIAACKVSYLEEVIGAVREKGYKFANYTKEMAMIESIKTILDENLDMQKVETTTIADFNGLRALTTKYQKLVPVDNLDDEIEV